MLKVYCKCSRRFRDGEVICPTCFTLRSASSPNGSPGSSRPVAERRSVNITIREPRAHATVVAKHNGPRHGQRPNPNGRAKVLGPQGSQGTQIIAKQVTSPYEAFYAVVTGSACIAKFP